MDSLAYLTKKMNRLGDMIDVGDLKESQLEDLVNYMKKKRMKFHLNEKRLVVTKMTKTNITHLFRYFLLGNTVSEISISLLYDCWEDNDKYDIRFFTNSVEAFLIKQNIDYFCFQGKLILKVETITL